MCTRFFIDVSNEELQEITGRAEHSVLMERFRMRGPARLISSGEVFPTNITAVIAPNPKGNAQVYPMHFGFRMQEGRPPILNARVETAAEKPAFRDAWNAHRCVVPCSYYFEWEHLKDSAGKVITKDKYLIQPAGEEITWLGGLYRIRDGLPEFVILTREPADALRRIHDRMPLLLSREALADWLRPDRKPEDLLPSALTEVYFEKTAG